MELVKSFLPTKVSSLIKMEDSSLSGRSSGWKGDASPEDQREAQQAVSSDGGVKKSKLKRTKNKGKRKKKKLILDNEKVLIRGNVVVLMHACQCTAVFFPLLMLALKQFNFEIYTGKVAFCLFSVLGKMKKDEGTDVAPLKLLGDRVFLNVHCHWIERDSF